MRSTFGICLTNVTDAYVRGDVLDAEFAAITLVFESVVGSTGNKNYNFNIFNKAIEYTVNHATTGTFLMSITCIISKGDHESSDVVVIPPVFLSESAGTPPTDGLISVTAEAGPSVVATHYVAVSANPILQTQMIDLDTAANWAGHSDIMLSIPSPVTKPSPNFPQALPPFILPPFYMRQADWKITKKKAVRLMFPVRYSDGRFNILVNCSGFQKILDTTPPILKSVVHRGEE